LEELPAIVHKRDAFIDFVRGLTIINMFIVHFRDSLPASLGSLIDLSDLAMESFVFLAGFMIGRHYLAKFKNDRNQVTKRLWSRAFEILMIHYMMIVTISMPFYSYFRLDNRQQLWDFTISSVFFLNQVPILHILPTFIPLFLLAPLILFCLDRNWDNWLLAASIMVFLIGNVRPDLIRFGDKVIFPVMLWQIYFVLGCYIGKFYLHLQRFPVRKFFFCALLACFLCAFIKFGGYFQWMRDIKTTLNLYPKKFPLNIYGLIYGVVLLSLFYSSALCIWEHVKRYRLFGKIISLFGRNSLAAFVIHAYFVFIVVTMQELAIHRFAVLSLVAASFYVTYRILTRIDRAKVVT
jgi:hypothetical protein